MTTASNCCLPTNSSVPLELSRHDKRSFSHRTFTKSSLTSTITTAAAVAAGAVVAAAVAAVVAAVSASFDDNRRQHHVAKYDAETGDREIEREREDIMALNH